MKRVPLHARHALFLLLAASLHAADPAPGHSTHGDAFNEGPRQAAVLMPGVGRIHFPITTSKPEAAEFFNQGVGQLHGFWYFEAERSFRQVAALDPDCAMAYWGMAMANINTPARAAKFIKKAAELQAKASPREQLWIKAWSAYHADDKKEDRARRNALIDALEDISFKHPDDLEAKAFLVFQLWDNETHNLPLPSRQAVDALAQQVLDKNPLHPGPNHYLIHLWNSGKSNEHALQAAARSGPSAPGIAHMWHMAGHTYSGLHRYADAAWQQEAAARVDHAQMIAHRIMPDQIHNYAHNNAWLIQDFRHLGRVHEALDLSKNLLELPRISSAKKSSYASGRDELLNTLLQYELWEETITLVSSGYLDPAPEADPADETRRRRLLGLAHLHAAHKGDKASLANGRKQIAQFEKFAADLAQQRITEMLAAEAKAKADKKSEDDIVKAIGQAVRRLSTKIENAESALAELRSVLALKEGRIEDAIQQADLSKDIPAERQARLRMELGQTDKALELARDAAKPDDQLLTPMASLAHLLWRAGKNKEAVDTFQKVRVLAADADTDCAFLTRLDPIAKNEKLPSDWRIPRKPATDIGERPPLAQLGPFRWHPSPAPSWKLPDDQWGTLSLDQFRGKPVLVLFYLGSGCVHCIEQLNIFAPFTKQYREAGISIVAVSTDEPSRLHWTLSKATKEDGFDFPIVSDSTLATFKAYRAYDDFEKTPLHGAFLIDAKGLVRWQDIGFQPFRDASWLLTESKRLLAIPADRLAPSASATAAAR